MSERLQCRGLENGLNFYSLTSVEEVCFLVCLKLLPRHTYTLLFSRASIWHTFLCLLQVKKRVKSSATFKQSRWKFRNIILLLWIERECSSQLLGSVLQRNLFTGFFLIASWKIECIWPYSLSSWENGSIIFPESNWNMIGLWPVETFYLYCRTK